MTLFSEPSGHVPSPDELVAAPFYPELSQRILGLGFGDFGWHPIRVEQLPRLAREREEQDIGWVSGGLAR